MRNFTSCFSYLHIGDPEHERQCSLRGSYFVQPSSLSLPQALEQRVTQPASIHGFNGCPDHQHAADAHSWSSPSASSATQARLSPIRPVSKQRRTSLLVVAAKPLRSTAAPRLTTGVSPQTVPTHRELCGIRFRLTGTFHWPGTHPKMYGRHRTSSINLRSRRGVM